MGEVARRRRREHYMRVAIHSSLECYFIKILYDFKWISKKKDSQVTAWIISRNFRKDFGASNSRDLKEISSIL